MRFCKFCIDSFSFTACTVIIFTLFGIGPSVGWWEGTLKEAGPAADEGKCEDLIGICYNDTCDDDYSPVDASCAGTDQHCCAPDDTLIAEWSKNDTECLQRLGNCQSNSTDCEIGDVESGLCGGPAERQCCIPSEETVDRWQSQDRNCSAVYGTCIHSGLAVNCSGDMIPGLCGGPDYRECCQPDEDKVDSWVEEEDDECMEKEGNCQASVSDCTDQHGEGHYESGMCGGPSNRQCCIPDEDTLELWYSHDQGCLEQYGRCQHVNVTCNGTMQAHQCAGPAYRECCLPFEAEVNDWITKDWRCEEELGTCQMEHLPCEVGEYEESMCGGPAERKCCVPSQETMDRWLSQDRNCSALYGTCIHSALAANCSGDMIPGLCGGPDYRECCQPDKDKVDSWVEKDDECMETEGTCQANVTDCTDQYGKGHYESGMCGGPSNRQCCIPDDSTLEIWYAHDHRCLEQYGRCQHINATCNGTLQAAQCAGPAYRECCVPFEAAVNDWISQDWRCEDKWGTCQMEHLHCEVGDYEENICGGPAERKCCVPSEETMAVWESKDGGCAELKGECQSNETECKGVYKEQVCGGPAIRQCCHRLSSPPLTPIIVGTVVPIVLILIVVLVCLIRQKKKVRRPRESNGAPSWSKVVGYAHMDDDVNLTDHEVAMAGAGTTDA